MTDPLDLTYVLPLEGNGRVEVHLHLVALPGEHAAQFVLDVLDRVNEFARIIAPGVKPVISGAEPRDPTAGYPVPRIRA